jgi:hypothetical protein
VVRRRGCEEVVCGTEHPCMSVSVRTVFRVGSGSKLRSMGSWDHGTTLGEPQSRKHLATKASRSAEKHSSEERSGSSVCIPMPYDARKLASASGRKTLSAG